MSLVRKFEEGGIPSTLYAFYDDKYDYNALRRAYDQGYQEYLSGLKRGSKDEALFRDAGEKLMSGIKSGRVTWNEGRYLDSQGEYTNSTDKNKNKDYMGLMANYIYNLMNQQQKYVSPEDKNKIKWDNGKGFSIALNRELFGRDTPDYDAWNQLDTTETGVKNRAARLVEAFTKMKANPNLFSDAKTIDYDSAITALQDGTIDPGDYMALSRIGIDYKNLLGAKQEIKDQEQEIKNQEQEGIHNQDELKAQFESEFPFTADLATITIGELPNYGEWTRKLIGRVNNSLSDKQLSTAIYRHLYDKNYQLSFLHDGEEHVVNHNYGLRSLLQLALKRGLAKQISSDNPNLYYIPNVGSKSRFTGWVWDKANNQMKEISGHYLPDMKQRAQNRWNELNHLGDSRYNVYYGKEAQSAKQGGILKAQTGTSVPEWYQKLEEAGDYDVTKYTTNWDTEHLYNSDYGSQNRTAWVSNQNGYNQGRYAPTNTDWSKAGEYENQEQYKAFTKLLYNEDGTPTELGKSWAKLTDANLPEGHSSRFYDENGNLRKSWTVKGLDAQNRGNNGAKTYNTFGEYAQALRNDQTLGTRHNTLVKKGKRYFYKDKYDTEHYVDPANIGNYIVSENPVESGWDGDTYWEIYQLTGLKNNQQQSSTPNNESGKGSEVRITEGDKNNPNGGINLSSTLNNLVPDLLASGRLAVSLRTNNRIANTLKKSLKPLLINPYELYHPVTGLYSLRQQGYNNAASMEHQASKTISSDASLQHARLLDTQLKANQQRAQVDLQDDQEIRRTQAEALKRQEANIKLRTGVANENRKSMNTTTREKAQVEAQRLNSNWQGINNFLKEVETRKRAQLEEKKVLNQQIAQSQVDSDYRINISKLDEQYRKQNPSGYDNRVYDSNYWRAVQDIKNLRQNQYYQILNNSYVYKPRKVLSLDEILKQHNFA